LHYPRLAGNFPHAIACAQEMHAFPEECIALNAVQWICAALLLANDFYRFKPESLQKP